MAGPAGRETRAKKDGPETGAASDDTDTLATRKGRETRAMRRVKIEQGLPVTPPQQLQNKGGPSKNATKANPPQRSGDKPGPSRNPSKGNRSKKPVSKLSSSDSDSSASSPPDIYRLQGISQKARELSQKIQKRKAKRNANKAFDFVPPPSAPAFPVGEASETTVVPAAPADTPHIPDVGPNESLSGPNVSQEGPKLPEAATVGQAFPRHATEAVVAPSMPKAVPAIPEGSGALYLRAPSQNDGLPITFSIPSKELANLFDFLASKYPVVDIDALTQRATESAPKLTINAGTKRQASEPLEGSRPARRVRITDGAEGKVATLSGQPHLGEYYYQPKQGDPNHSQKYRMVVPPENPDDPTYRTAVPLYDNKGRIYSDTYENVFVPVQDSDDDSDLDTELDAASSSFKENIPVEQEKLRSPPRASGIATHSSEEGAGIGQENAGVSELDREVQHPEIPPARELQAPQTPSTRWTLGTIINSAVKFIPGLGHVAETQLAPAAAPVVASAASISPTEVLTTPSQPTSHTQRLPPQTEPRHASQPDTPQQQPPKSRQQAASARVTHAKGRSRVREENERLSVQRRADKMHKRKNLAEAEAAEIEAKRRELDEEEQELQRKRTQLVLQEETLQQKAAMAKQRRPDSGLVWRRTSKIRAERAAKESALFSGPRGPYPTGSRIAEARAAKKSERRKNSPDRIPGPAGGGYGMNDEYFIVDSDDDDEATTTDANVSNLVKDSNFPVGDPHKAQPALGSYFQHPATEPELHGGNVFRDADADEETAARAVKIKELAAKQPPRTPSGAIITNLSGHFTVPDDSDSSSSDGEESNVANSTPAPKRSVKESLSEMSIFRNDNLSRSGLRKERPKPGPPDPNARLAKDSVWRHIYLPGRSEILPPLPPTPSPAHAQLPGPTVPSARSTRTFSQKKPLQGILKGTRKPQPPAPTVEDSESLKAARAKALQHAPRQPSNLRESHLIASSPQALEQTAAEPLVAEVNSTRPPSPEIAEASSLAAAAKESDTIAKASSSAAAAKESDTIAEASSSTAAAAKESDTTVDDEADAVQTPPQDPEEEVMYYGMKTKRKVADFIENNWTEEDEEAAANDFLAGYEEFMKTYVKPSTGFTSRVESWLKSPEVERAAEEDAEEIAADIEKSLARGFAV